MVSPRAEPAPSALTRILAERIQGSGAVTFADYMETCLYHPQFGYYSRAAVQPLRDYYTSSDVHPIFGRLLARQFHEMWILLGSPSPFYLIELGAGMGRLARSILDLLMRSFPELYSNLIYLALERSASRRTLLGAEIAGHISAEHAQAGATLPAKTAAGCVFSNEFFDALPVHRVLQTGGTLKEIWISHAAGAFQEQLGSLSSGALEDYLHVLRIALREGQQAEVNLEACRWIEEIARNLVRGFVLTVDYGYRAAELYAAHRMRGTLLAYRQHRASEGFYLAPGEQDLTAHVNFSALEHWGAQAGLATTGFTSQTNFLLSIAEAADFADVASAGAADIASQRARLLFQNLIHPAGMGERFRVLVQHKGVVAPRLTGLVRL